NILGFHTEGNKLRIEPCIPGDWKQFEITYRYRSATYHIVVQNPEGVERGIQRVLIDGQAVQDRVIELIDSQRVHEILVVMGKSPLCALFVTRTSLSRRQKKWESRC